MRPRDAELDAQLEALFAGLDASADFDVRVMLRLQADTHSEAMDRILLLRRREQQRHVGELRIARRSTLRAMTLGVLGSSFLAVALFVVAWRLGSRAVEDLRAYGWWVATAYGLLFAAV